LDDKLKWTNSGVVLAVVKIFLNYTQNISHVHEHVYQRIKEPILSLLAGVRPELSYAILKHIHLIVTRQPALFSSDYTRFLSLSPFSS